LFIYFFQNKIMLCCTATNIHWLAKKQFIISFESADNNTPVHYIEITVDKVSQEKRFITKYNSLININDDY
jgi:hypothetical protein